VKGNLRVKAEPSPDPVREILLRAVRTDGPARLAEAGGSSLSAVLRHGTSPWLGEEPRARNEPLRVRPTQAGLAWLLEITPPGEREDLVRKASPLYQEALFAAWTTLVRERGEAEERHAWERCGRGLAARFRTGDDAEEFRRALAGELVLGWKRASHPEAREEIARALRAAGVRAVGEAGQRTTFSGRWHVSSAAVFPGDPVVVRESGWCLADAGGDLVLEKAVVEAEAP